MALPERHYRGDIIVMVDWAAANGVGTTWVNFCGATSFDLTIDNAIQEESVADCDDWTLPAQNIATYGAQTWTFSLGATLAKSNRDKLLRAVSDQKLLPIRIHIVGAKTGEVRYIDGAALLPSLSWGNIANADGGTITASLSGRFAEKPKFTNAT